ncbi:hypothetical protein [Pseudomonas aeruginosa]|uniref:hypothetical protein n=1 Tax=Pseudomonas aeruginosa TaxID=287 RepID=UPI0015E31DE6|nr:hypothetical protein [Pseudomonas aeruginosa]
MGVRVSVESAPLEHVAYVISEFKTGRQCGLLHMKAKRRLISAAERHLAEVVRVQGETELVRLIEQTQAEGTLNDY